ncbi:MAG TPA: glycosyltransferase [Gaiellaceae bacterium]|jgi:glycosyltransferase involved in cell wall biosynthesis|nr:glycosyltransferase [Gaiellaceae bacterium]
MERLPLRRLVSGPQPAPDRIFFTSLWFKGHNNPRYAELLPRLSRLDRYLFLASDHRVPRALEYRAYRWSRRIRNPLLMKLGAQRYRGMFTADPEQIPFFDGPVVADVDDPYYTQAHVDLLNHPNLAAYVVTAERAARQYEEMGVRKPFHVIPQGISFSSLRDDYLEEARRRKGDSVVVGWMAAWLLTDGDRDAEGPLYNIDHLLELWPRIHERAPNTRLWLIGGASDRVQERLRDRDDVVLWGRLERDRALSTAASFDISLYPRTEDTGIQAAKVGEFIGLGVPTVSYDYKVTENLRELDAGLLVETPDEFVDAVVELATDEAKRRALSESTARAGRTLDWDVLAERYEEILAAYIPPA